MKHYILFTGHMIDAAGRLKPRFPSFKENVVREEIYQRLLQHKTTYNDIEGMASGACGGDILFHEVCAELNIPTQVYLAMPAEEFRKNSVSFADADWDERFDALLQQLPVYMLPEQTENTTMNVYEQTNEWMLQTALTHGGENVTLMALWDGGGGDGKGGTEHAIKIAKEKGSQADVIDIKQL